MRGRIEWDRVPPRSPVMEETVVRQRIKEVMVEELMLDQAPEEIGDEVPFFGAEGMGLDSVDALQLAVAAEKEFGVKLSDAQVARETMRDVATLAQFIVASRQN